MKKISILVPCYNEQSCIEPFYAEIIATLKKIQNVTYELLFVDDGSIDSTYEKITALHKKDKRVKCISFSRNFGKEAALFSGLRAVTGDCVVVLDADLQHPPATIVEMYKKWQEGFDIVEGTKTTRGKESPVHTLFSKLFYQMISKAVGMDMMNSSDFKLLDRKVIDQLASLKERNTFFRALSFWVGFKRTSVNYEVQDRVSGKSKWSFKSLFRYALNNVFCFTDAPLKLISKAGILFLLIGLIIGIDALVSHIRGVAASGYPTLIFIIFFASGCILFSLGIIGIYIAKIYDEVKSRPQYIVGKKIE